MSAVAVATATETYLTVIKPGTACSDFPSELAATYPFSLDPFQQHSIMAIRRGHNVLVTAKTGSGKTLVGEAQIRESLGAGRRVFYTTPIKTLSNQKFYDLKKVFPEASVGIMTGDIKFMPDAQIVIMTTEILSNLLYKKGTDTESLGLTASISLDGLDAVIFDECHYINDPDRGNVWEETIVNLPKDVKIIMLSATIDRSEQFAAWVGKVRQRPIVHIATTHRVVPLTHYCAAVAADGSATMELTEICATGADGREVYDAAAYRRWSNKKHADYKKEREFKEAAKAHAATNKAAKAAALAAGEAALHALPAAEGKFHQTSYIHQLNVTVNSLKEKEMLPALFFVFNRDNCEKFAAALESSLLDSSDSAQVTHIIDYHLRNHKETLQSVSQYYTITDLLKKGIAYHHSGLHPLLKEIVEILFAKGLIRVLFCTETFAVGINMPTRTVVFTELRKHDNSGLRVVRPDEYIQMAGRAGRRGKDVRGNVIYLPAHGPVHPQEMQTIMGGGLPGLYSRIKFSYPFILKAFHAGDEKWRQIIADSYWYQQSLEELEQTKKEADAAQDAVVALNLEEVIKDLEERDQLEVKIKTSVNAARKEAQRSLDHWNNKHMGSKWNNAIQLWPKYKKLKAEADRYMKQYERSVQTCTDFDALIEPQVKYLQVNGYLDEAKALTRKGTMATEINEGHPILMTELYLSGALASLSAPALIAALAAFICERSIEHDTLEPVCDEIQPVIDALIRIRDTMSDGDSSNWRISTEHVGIAYDWLHGRPPAEICTEYNLFEGNLTKTVMKLKNLMEELQTIAEFNNDVGMLEKIKDLDVVHGIAIPDSLYLRL